MTTRTDRIDQLLRQEIGEILGREIQDPRIGFVTVTDVDTAPDLSTARVWVSVIGQPQERDQTLRALQRAMPFVRRELGARVRLRRIPELLVRADDTAERGTRVLRLLSELEAGHTPDDASLPGESLPTPAPRSAQIAAVRESSGSSPRRTCTAARARSRPAAMTVDLRPWLDAVPGAAAEAIAASRHALVATHENPDADTLGAALGVAAVVEHHGGRATLISTDPVPPLYAFLEGMDRFVADPEDAGDYDLLVVCDCGTLDRLGGVLDRHRALFERLPRVLVDHHASNTDGGPSDWVDPTAAATCELVALLAAKLGVPLDADGGAIAAALMAGIVMDTSTFAHPNSTPRTLAVSAALVAAGAPLSDISRRLYRSKPDAQLRLFGRVLDRLEVTHGGKVIHSSLADADLAATGTLSSHSEGLIDLLAQSETAEVAILFKESGPEATRVSVRTKPGGVDATVLTGAFGGGGHARAAGATIAAPLAEARTRFLAEAERLADAVSRPVPA